MSEEITTHALLMSGNRKAYLARRSEQNRKAYKKCKPFVDRVKLMYGCAFCGYKQHPSALHFDHLDPKTKVASIAKMMSGSVQNIKKEMRKCRILCANCHAVHTVKQRQGGIL